MINLLITISFICLITSCNNNNNNQQQLTDVLQSIAKGEHPELLAGFNPEAMKKIHHKQFMQKHELAYDIRTGDAPAPLGDGSCDYHAFISESPSHTPFIGVRMQRKEGEWYIIGYWTP